MTKPYLKFQISDIGSIAERYRYVLDDSKLINIKARVLKQNRLIKDDLRQIAKWKSPRSAGHVEKNAEEFIEEITFDKALWQFSKEAGVIQSSNP